MLLYTKVFKMNTFLVYWVVYLIIGNVITDVNSYHR